MAWEHNDNAIKLGVRICIETCARGCFVDFHQSIWTTLVSGTNKFHLFAMDKLSVKEYEDPFKG